MRKTNCGCLITLSYYYLVVFWFFCILASHAAVDNDTLPAGQVMRDWKFLESSNKLFRLRFFSIQGSGSRYLGILGFSFSSSGAFVSQAPIDTATTKIVWFANRDNPLNDTSGYLNITQDGNLVLNDDKGTVVAISTTEQPPPSCTINATLLDTGNLVLRAGNRILWQSFDHPSDMWLPGMKLGVFHSTTGETQQRLLTSWVSPKAPRIGAFTFGVDPDNRKELVIWRRGVVNWRSGMWNGYNFSYFPKMTAASSDLSLGLSFSYFSNESQSYVTYNDNKSRHFIEIAASGATSILPMDGLGGWWVSDSGYCDPSIPSKDNHTGCAKNNPQPSTCKAGDTFHRYTNLSMYIPYYLYNDSLGISDCEDMCMKNCSCNAYASLSTDETGCKFSQGPIFDVGIGNDLIYMRKGTVTQDAFLPTLAMAPAAATTTDAAPTPINPWNRPQSTSPTPTRGHPGKRPLMLIIGVPVASMFILPVVTLLCYLRWRNRNFAGNNGKSKKGISRGGIQSLMFDRNTEAAIVDEDHELPLFTFPSIKIATNFFSDANKIGQGGFGPVYKGKLPNGQEIAVKRLSKSSGQGLEEFKNEVILISRLQHRNLVRLLGCCAQGDERILIYEYMPNKSLDSFLFDTTRRALLDWTIRVSIIEGIAQGLLYLHKYSRLKVIHRDLKTSNILLDSNMNPKISDFGTARIFGDNESRANTSRIVGTHGYMSPEYALDGLFSVKSDIFSFGIMMLEIISGKKNTGFYQPDRALNLVGYAWDLWREGRGLEIMNGSCVTRNIFRK